MSMQDLIEAARVSKAWPFQEAQRLLKRYPDGTKPGGEPVLFETGYGPSGLPHIGTFQEVLRTTLVRRAFEALIGAKPEDGKTRLVAFSDDMDGLRKVPDNVPNAQLLQDNLHKPLSRIPNPFGTDHDSFAAHNNAKLREFLDRFGFDYEFIASHTQYDTGVFDEALKKVLAHNQAILDIMLPTLRAERAATYSPIMPISPVTGRVLQVPVEVIDAEAGTIRFTDEDGTVVEQSALGGQAKLQWKVDFAMRWVALSVDYEMYGKDLTDTGIQSGKIAKVLGGRKPEGLIYELFLDEKGEKISKSKGNGLTIEEWLTYGSEESLGFYIFPNPKSAKQLHVGVIPRAVDDYWQFRERLPEQALDKQLGNPVWHLARANGGYEAEEAPGAGDSLPVTYGLLLNLVGVMGATATREQVWSYLGNYIEDPDPAKHPELDGLVTTALAYNRDFVAPTLNRRAPTPNEASALAALDGELSQVSADTSAEDLQTIVYETGKREEFGFDNLRDWFKALYETLLGSEQGPRMGSFIALYGVQNTRKLIAEALAAANTAG
ncbi:lysine--tRNA ligase [Citromicrobium sp. RCC1885]|uniref:lysine--tRNA ligase n=1 Tax=unclassified Citromicrobium TaxID=2630544 RepID=UPI0006C8F93E|nr:MULTISPECIES: lysine--tRNA ligase [unclassified Citromicrobium]MAO04308.1 lysine--tRNA ligase [Citromicrobium sp.]KPM23000.1 lysine--tRNA ligase [Citromicrobium sp. RCC1885]KPM27142.1 lysine--tRNA ligase [Citromicrobium sp. RCC1878]MAO05194.1 lysine--tRNA ligase [Citromicrobium sp.]OAM09088.1 lysine--tRNA ligase [Citromicrobium sp. RCC1897]